MSVSVVFLDRSVLIQPSTAYPTKTGENCPLRRPIAFKDHNIVKVPTRPTQDILFPVYPDATGMFESGPRRSANRYHDFVDYHAESGRSVRYVPG